MKLFFLLLSCWVSFFVIKGIFLNLFRSRLKSSEFKKLVNKELRPYLNQNGFIGKNWTYKNENEQFIKEIIFRPWRSGGGISVDYDITIKIFENPTEKLRNPKFRYTEHKSNFDKTIRNLLLIKVSSLSWDYSRSNKGNSKIIKQIKKEIEKKAFAHFNLIENYQTNLLKLNINEIFNHKKLNIEYNSIRHPDSWIDVILQLHTFCNNNEMVNIINKFKG